TQFDDESGLGLGIGLALARHLVVMHGGTIDVASEGVGRGTVFTVHLPLSSGLAVETSHNDVPAMGSSLRVLIVDDNVDAAETLSAVLTLSGHVTRLVHTGAKALPEALDFNPDVILLDIGLPELDGYAVARLIRNEPALRSVAVVALTGWGSEEDRRQARNAGFDEHLVKPVDTAQLAAVLFGIKR